MRVDLVFFDGCPHVALARGRLREALVRASAPVRWDEWDTTLESTPAHLLGYASPTILVDGLDVEHKPVASAAGCSVSGGPDVDSLVRAICGAGPPW